VSKQETLWLSLLVLLPACALSVAADDSKSLPISSVTVKDRLTLKDALAAVQKQTGNSVIDLRDALGQPAPNPELTLELNGMGFWPALDRIAQQARVQVYPYVDPKTNKPAVGIVGPDAATGALPPLQAAYSGPFRFVLKRVTAQRERLSITLELACEPRFEPLLLRVGKESVKLRDTGGAWKSVEQAGVGAIKLLRESPVELTLHLPPPAASRERQRPESGTKQLPELRCEFIALVHPERLDFAFVKLAAGEKVVNKNVSTTLSRIDVDRQSGRTYLSFAVQYPKGSLDLESHQTWAAEGHEVLLKNSAGKRELKPVGNPLISVEEGGPMRITYTLPEALADLSGWSLVYRTPATPVAVPLQVSFKDVPLP
jgi:hypothetical protein